MGIPLASVAELRAIEHEAERELPAGALMARAGRAAARRIDEMAGDRRLRVAVVCGPGNNGGDGFVVAVELVQRGHEAVCVLVGAQTPAARDARDAFEHWRRFDGVVTPTLPTETFDLVVDGLLGIGAARPLAGAFLEAAEWINAQPGAIVALDVPSGLDADRGGWIGGVAGVRADRTITFIADKAGLHTGAGADAAGEIIVEPIGVAAPAGALSLVTPADFDAVIRPRRRDTHKGSYGDLLVLGGATGMVGAPLLAARAGLRLGAGRVYVDCIGAPELSFDPLQPELMFRRHHDLSALTAIVVGCGLGTDERSRAALDWALQGPAALVIDADGLNLIAQSTPASQRASATVLTPHPLEAARLLGSDVTSVQADRVDSARRLSQRFGAIVVLKGAGSVIAGPDGRCAINSTGSPALATAGSGDVLAGMIGALLAQRYDAWNATLAAVWLHGESVAGLGDRGIVASELAQRAVGALRALQSSSR